MPFFPLAYAVDQEHPLEFDFSSRVLDSLALPLPINIREGESGPVTFGSVGEATAYVRREISHFCQGRQPVAQNERAGAALDKRAIFVECCTSLRDRLLSGKPELDENVDNV